MALSKKKKKKKKKKVRKNEWIYKQTDSEFVTLAYDFLKWNYVGVDRGIYGWLPWRIYCEAFSIAKLTIWGKLQAQQILPETNVVVTELWPQSSTVICIGPQFFCVCFIFYVSTLYYFSCLYFETSRILLFPNLFLNLHMLHFSSVIFCLVLIRFGFMAYLSL